MKQIEGGVCAAKGFQAAGVHCGIRKNRDKADLALVWSDAPCAGAAVYTTNKVYGAPIKIDREHLQNGRAQAILCNSGNANTCAPGAEALARDSCALAGEALGIPAEDVLVCSTGVIGQPMELEPFRRGVPLAAAALAYGPAAATAAAQAIMTTDTHPKQAAVEFTLDGKVCRLGAMAKGSGMINPNMATMLLFMTTDAAVEAAVLQKALGDVVKATFNQISVDGDTSTNDTVLLLANGLAGNPPIADAGADYAAFYAALHTVAEDMCRQIAGDGEGCTKLLECLVTGAPSLEVARGVSKSVIQSDLLKAAMFGSDANWGRILCAIGYTPGDFSIDKTRVWLESEKGSVFVCENAAYHEYSETEATQVLTAKEILLRVDLGQGDFSAKAWGCDLTYDYVRINGDYRS